MGKYYEKINFDWTEDSSRVFVSHGNKELQKIIFYIQEIGYFSTFPSYYAQRENLNSFLILLTLSGTGKLNYNNKSYILDKDTIFFVDCHSKHKYMNNSSKNWDFVWMHFNGFNAQAFYEMFYNQNNGVVAKVSSNKIETLLNDILNINKKQLNNADILSFPLISQILSELLILNHSNNYTNSIPKIYSEIQKEIEDKFTTDISLDSLSKKFFINKYTISRSFRKYFNIGIKEYIVNKRIDYAKCLLKFSDMSINQISSVVGYQNPEYFISVFKDNENITPFNYRKKTR